MKKNKLLFPFSCLLALLAPSLAQAVNTHTWSLTETQFNGKNYPSIDALDVGSIDSSGFYVAPSTTPLEPESSMEEAWLE